MKKIFLIVAVLLGVILLFTACNGNTSTDIADNNVNMQAENQADNNADMQVEDYTDIQNEYGTNEMVGANSESELAEEAESEDEVEFKEETGEQTEMKMNVQIGDYNFTATLEKNAAVEELMDMMKDGPVTIQMDDYSGFEKVGSLGRHLTTSNSQTTTSAGDIVLYNGNNIVMFYGSNSWSYTRIGKIDDLSDWEKALGSGSITAVFTLAE